MNYINPPSECPENVFHRTFFSEIYAHEIGYNIYLPAGYETGDKKYPVVYHLHGWMGNESSEILAMEKICRGREAITVFPNHSHVTGNVEQLPSAPTFIEELIPHIDGLYRTDASRAGRAISGFSMGGGTAASLAFRYPELFSSVTAYAGTYHHYYHKDYSTVGTPAEKAAEIYRTMMAEGKYSDGNILCLLSDNADRIRSRMKIALHIGTDDVLYCDNEILRMHLEALHIAHEYRRFEGAGHTLSLIL